MWKTIVCTMQGRSHAAKDLPCQDKTAEAIGDTSTAVALADGAGSARLSHFGAACTTQAATAVLSTALAELLNEPDGRLAKLRLLSAVQEALDAEKAALACETRDLACTLLCAAADREHFLLGHVGDGVIGYLQNGEVKVASHPENGEFSNTTVFVTSGRAAESMKLFKGTVGSIKGFVLMTDGTEAALYHKRDKCLAPALKRMIHLCRLLPKARAEQLLAETLQNTVSKATTDDCGIAFLVNAPENLQEYLSLSNTERCEMLGIRLGTPSAAKRLARYDRLLDFLSTPHTLMQIARFLHLRPAYAKRHVARLYYHGFLEEVGARYQLVEGLRA